MSRPNADTRPYVGLHGETRTRFRSRAAPVAVPYHVIVGPFRTARAAELCRVGGCLWTVAEYERAARHIIRFASQE